MERLLGSRHEVKVKNSETDRSLSSRNLLYSVRKGLITTTGPYNVGGTEQMKHICLGQILNLVIPILFFVSIVNFLSSTMRYIVPARLKFLSFYREERKKITKIEFSLGKLIHFQKK